jgi:hypothetical protein
MIDVTSMSEQSQLFIMWLQIILIILLILRLGRLALYFIKKDNDKFKKLVSSLSQLLYPSIYLFVVMLNYSHISSVLIDLLTINLLIRPSIDIITKSDNDRDILLVKICYLIQLVFLLMDLIKIMLEK